jgi:glycosyltransferase involved in cell wall biosynthesis
MINPLISIISPVYKAEKIIPELVKRVYSSVAEITPDFEIILVEDGGPDNSWLAIEEQCKKYSFVKGIKLSRNFGQHYAITAGLQLAKGDYVIVIDCDLQDNPVYFKPLYETALKGFDIVYTYKTKRKHSFFKNITASIFFSIFNYLNDNKNVDANKNVGSYSLLSRKVVESYKSMKEGNRHYLMILRLLGYKSTYLEILHEERFEGKSSYSFSKLVKHAINGVTSQSDKLLRISINIGFLIFIMSIIWTGIIVYIYFHTGLLNGYASIMATLLLGIGLILMSIGIAGIYIGKIFEQVKERPLYIIEKQINL